MYYSLKWLLNRGVTVWTENRVPRKNHGSVRTENRRPKISVRFGFFLIVDTHINLKHNIAYIQYFIIQLFQTHNNWAIKKLPNFYTFYDIIKPMNHVCPSVCRHLGHYLVRTRSRLFLMGFRFPFAHAKKNMSKLCVGVNLKNGNFRKMVIWGLSAIIDCSLYGRVLGYSTMDFFSFRTWKETIFRAVRMRIILEILQKLKFWRI